MKRKLNENEEFNEELLDGVKICVSDIRNDDSEMDCNELRDIFVEAGAEVFGSHGLKDGDPATFMTVKGLTEEQVLEILQEFLDNSDSCADADTYIIDNEDAYFNDIDSESDYPAYEDVETDELDPEEDALNDDFLNEGEDILEDAKEELRDVLSRVDDEIYLSDDGIVLDTVLSDDNLTVYSIYANGDMETNEETVINAFDLTDADDIFTLCDVIKDTLDFDAQYPAYDNIDIDDNEESPRFEKMKHHRRLDEKRKGCCPGTKTVNEVDAVLNDIDKNALNESKKQKSLEVKTLKALSENKHSLHENISYNGKSFAKMTLKELKNLYETVNASIEILNNKSLNENANENLLNTIKRKKQLLNYLDEEITYRTTRTECLNKLNEDNAEISDEELKTLFGPAQGEDETPTENTEDSNNSEDSKDSNTEDSNNSEDGEVVELSRIVITLKDSEAANDLKQACIEAEIPEDAFELENVEEESATEDEESSEENSNKENSEENSEESSEENSEDENTEDNANESYEFAKYVKMLGEGEVADEQPADDANGEEDGGEENGEEDANSEDNKENSDDEEEDKQPKFILTNTDYANKLAKVLEDVYGISKEEFEDMIGGPIVEENSEESSEENSEESSDENKEKSSDENKDDSEEEIDPSDLFKNL